MNFVCRFLLFRAMSTVICAALLPLATGAASAQEVRVYSAGESVDPQDVARILGPSAEAPAFKMRSLRLLDDNGTPASTVRAGSGSAATSGGSRQSALALLVQFAFDSAEILPATKPQLDSLAAGIRLLPPTKAIVIEGHTDSRGTDFYNEVLSQKRAATVKRYLITVAGIEPDRLRTVGRGKADPLPGRDPMAPENRRVQFRGE